MESAPQYFIYSEEETAALRAACPAMEKAIAAIGPIRREVEPNLFPALVNSIVGQQISTKAQVTIWGRMCGRFPPMTPAVLAAASEADIQACGVSMRKASYIRDLALRVESGRFDLAALHELPDGEVCRRLSELKGIGVWTAEMMMIFSMQRPDVMSFGDLAIHRGLRMLHRHRAVTPKLFAKYRRRYSPYGSVASLYLWAVAGGALPELTDPAAKKKPPPKKEAAGCLPPNAVRDRCVL